MKHKPYYIITENSTPMVISELFDETPLTQKEISERSGIHYRTLSEYKYGGSLPTLRCLLYVLDAIGKTLMVVDKDEAPTAAHGWWIMKETCGPNTEKPHCSECDKIPRSLHCEDYCPNCGAKMEGCGNA